MRRRTLDPLHDRFDAFFFVITIAYIGLMMLVIAASGLLLPLIDDLLHG